MTCPTQLNLSSLADGALAPVTASEVERHVRDCERCAALLAALRRESTQLRAALAADAAVAIPAFHRPLHAGDLLAFTAGLTSIAWLVDAFWGGLAAAIPAALRWLNPLDPHNIRVSLFDFAWYFASEGTAMLSSASMIAATVAVLAIAGLFALALHRSRSGAAVVFSVLLLVAALPPVGHTLEVRGGSEAIVVAETIDDTLVAFGESVTIDGDVNGDLFAFGRRVIVRGSVAGNVFAGGQSVSIEGAVGGSVFGGGETLALSETQIARNLFGGGRDVTVDKDTAIGGNAVTAADTAAIAGRVGVDLRSYARTIEVRGSIGRNVDAYAESIDVNALAQIGGDLTAHVAAADKLRVASGATVGGNVVTDVGDHDGPRRPAGNRFATASFYFGQLVRLGAALVAGLILLWLFPALRTIVLRRPIDGLKAGGIGLLTAIAAPFAVILTAITVIGLPVALITAVLGVIGFYLAKIVVANMIGRRLLQPPTGEPKLVWSLLTGLIIVIVAVNIPLIGGLANVVLTLIGAGLLVLAISGDISARASQPIEDR